MDVTIENITLIFCGFMLGIIFWNTIQEHLDCFNARTVRKMNKRIYNIKKLIRKTNKQIKHYVKTDSCPTQYYRIDCTTIPPVYIDKFQQYYIDRGFKVWIDKKTNAFNISLSILYISWEENDVPSSDNNE